MLHYCVVVHFMRFWDANATYKGEKPTTIYSTLYNEPCMLGRNDTTTWTILSDIIWNIRWSLGSTICKSKPHALPSTDEQVQKAMCVSVRVTSAISLWPNDTVLLIQGQHDQHTTCTTTFHNGQGRWWWYQSNAHTNLQSRQSTWYQQDSEFLLECGISTGILPWALKVDPSTPFQ